MSSTTSSAVSEVGLQRTFAEEGEEAKQAFAVLADQIGAGEFTPVIGPLLAREILGTRQDLALRWVRYWKMPILKRSQDDLAQVAQYLRVRLPSDDDVRTSLQQLVMDDIRKRQRDDPHDPVWGLPDQLVAGRNPARAILEAGRRLRTIDKRDPYGILAELNTSIYVTTGWTDLLCKALEENGRKPITRAFKWRGAPEAPTVEWPLPTPQRPLVYHLYGRIDDLKSLVLSEDNYFTWLNAWAIQRKSVPTSVLKALTAKPLVFLGYRLDDWDFRVVFRAIWNLGGSELLKRNQHIAVQFPPESQLIRPKDAQKYLESYFGQSNVTISWAETREFLDRIRRSVAA